MSAGITKRGSKKKDDNNNISSSLSSSTLAEESSSRERNLFHLDSDDTKCVVVSKIPATKARSALQFLREVFLPDGFPDSVSKDYVPYQICDTLQAFCSNITGLLATRATFKRAGVGDATATATAATLIRVMQDGTGMIGRILFAWQVSFVLDADCKQWRFYADILNDASIFIEVVAPSCPKSWFVTLACFSTLIRSLCGVAGGSTKAALSQHFAIKGNTADLNAKDGSQETIVGLVGMLLGSVIVHAIPDDAIILTWACLFTLTALHLTFNFIGISSVVMTSLNTQRATILINRYFESDHTEALTPQQVAAKESIIFWKAPPVVLGVSLQKVLTGRQSLVAEKELRHLHISKIEAECVERVLKDFDGFVGRLIAAGWKVDGQRSLIAAKDYRYKIKERKD
ncbi:hypothetical protein HDU76_007812 [Blyttiomyces sp. JEL0837]|nr:hypothetical protein HDU76_007812 [Blyttiomyces sp. JEL0837]